MKLALNAPLNSVSFGQVSFALLREMLTSDLKPLLFPIGQVDLSSQEVEKDLFEDLESLLSYSLVNHSRDLPSLKLWHLNGSLESISRDQHLLSFYELDSPTDIELNIAKNNKTIFTSEYTVSVFRENGVECDYVPLFFDHFNFKPKKQEYFEDDRITFNLSGKFEHRKHHLKIIQSWIKKYGGSSKYFLQCSLFNPFLSQEDNEALIARALNNQKYPNVHIMHPMAKNELYNDFLNSADIVIGMSGGEGWGLPEFQSLALGKHGVILNAHAYKGWANEKNAVMVEPSGKTDAYDGIFFAEGGNFNQGQIFDWEEDAFLSACDEVVKRVKNDRVNSEGLKLQKDFTVKKTLDKLMGLINNN